MDTSAQGLSFLANWTESAIGVFNPATGQYTKYPTPTHGSGPRRGDVDDQGRYWVGLFWAGQVGMLDSDQGQVEEYDMIPGHVPFTPTFPSLYSVKVDDANQIVWANDFYSRRIFSIDMQTKEPTEYYMPLPYEVRDLFVEDNAPRPTVWIPAYRPPSRLVRIEVY